MSRKNVGEKKKSLLERVRALLVFTSKLKKNIKKYQNEKKTQKYRTTKLNSLRKTKEKSLSEIIDALDSVNKNCKEFSKMLLSKSNKFSEHQKLLCQSMYFKNAAAYRYSRDVIMKLV